MTTISALKGKDFIIIGSDSQVSLGNIRLPFPYKKIERVGSNLIAGTGSVGNLQRVLSLALRDIRINRVAVDNLDLNPCLNELAKKLAELNFSLPLEHKHYNPFSFLIGGLDDEENPALVSVGDDGSIINVPTYYADGSGMDFALTTLGQSYHSDISKEEAGRLIFNSLSQSTKHDIYTNNTPLVVCLSTNGEQWEINDLKLEEKKECS